MSAMQSLTQEKNFLNNANGPNKLNDHTIFEIFLIYY